MRGWNFIFTNPLHFVVNVFNHCMYGVSVRECECTIAICHISRCWKLSSALFFVPITHPLANPFALFRVGHKIVVCTKNCCVRACVCVRLIRCEAVNHHLTTNLPARFLKFSRPPFVNNTFALLSFRLWFCLSVIHWYNRFLHFSKHRAILSRNVDGRSSENSTKQAWRKVDSNASGSGMVWDLEEHLLFVFVCLVLCVKWFGKVPLLLAKLFN